jgi:nucleoside-diphosphate kinase
MIKPDGVQRGLVGSVIARFEAKGFKLCALKQASPSVEHLAAHYEDLSGKKFFRSLIEYMASAPVVAMVWQGAGVVAEGRKMLGATKPSESLMGTIRGDFCIDIGRNVCHGSDGPDAAEHEIALWFPEGVNTYEDHSAAWISEAAAAAAAPKQPKKPRQARKPKAAVAAPPKPKAAVAAPPKKVFDPKETPQQFAARFLREKKEKEAVRLAEARAKRERRQALKLSEATAEGGGAEAEEEWVMVQSPKDGAAESEDDEEDEQERAPRAARAPKAPKAPTFVFEDVVGAPTLHAAHGSSPRISEVAKAKLSEISAKQKSAPKKWGAGASPREAKLRAPPGGTMLKCSDEVVPLTKVQAQVLKQMGLKDPSKTTGTMVKSALNTPRAMALAKDIVKSEMS